MPPPAFAPVRPSASPPLPSNHLFFNRLQLRLSPPSDPARLVPATPVPGPSGSDPGFPTPWPPVSGLSLGGFNALRSDVVAGRDPPPGRVPQPDFRTPSGLHPGGHRNGFLSVRG